MRRVIAVLVAAVLLAGCSTPESSKEKGFALYDLGQYKKAHSLFEKAFAGGIDDPELVVRLAYCRAFINADPTGAISLLRDSALKYPRYARTYYELGYIAEQFGPSDSLMNIKQALGFTLKAAALDSSDWRIADNAGMYYFRLSSLDSAKRWFEAARAIKPDDAELNQRLAQIIEIQAKQQADSTAK